MKVRADEKTLKNVILLVCYKGQHNKVINSFCINIIPHAE